MKKLSIANITLISLCCFATTIAQAQKLPDLPNLQTISLRAPAGIKIDGKIIEWGDKMQAYNKATEIYYTISNDDDKLYLTVQARYQDVVDKIIRGGLSFTINHTTKKYDKEHVAVTYPVLRDNVMAELSNNYARKVNQHRDANKAIAVDDINQLFEARSKLINVEGIKTIAEADISVYNEEGIRAATTFDGNVVYTYELAIPLKYLNLPNGGTAPFAYHIKLNEPAEMSKKAISANAPPPPPMVTNQLSPTDFWGEYTLAKK